MVETASFGYWVRRRRKALDLTQSQLAQLVCCALVTIKKIEGDERRPSRQIGERLADVLAIAPEEKELFLACARGQISPLNLPIYSEPVRRAPPHNLPAALTSFVGRTHQVERLANLLRRPSVRLLTLTGPGGVGKTRLALRLARNLLEAFKDGVYVVNLAAITPTPAPHPGRPVAVARLIMQTLGIREPASGDAVLHLQKVLGTKEMLLVLDNFEHLLDTAVLVSEMLGSAPGMKVIATSRETLQLSGEHVFVVEPLEATAAQQLFTERTRAVHLDFSLTPDNRVAVGEICRRLDGLPLAIELAAATMKFWPPETLLEKLGRRLPLLVGGPRDAPARQKTLRSTLDWSYELLEEGERRLFRRLAVFTNGFSAEAAEAVCAFEESGGATLIGQRNRAIEDQLLSLERKSLINQQVVAAEARFYLLETVREYALELLEASEESDVAREHHLDYFVEMAQATEARVYSGQLTDSDYLARLAPEYENVNVALTWAFEGHKPEQGARLSSAMKLFWYTQGYLSEGRVWLERSLEFAQSRNGIRASVLTGAGLMAWQQGEYGMARRYLDESQEILIELGQLEGREMAFTVHVLGHVRLDQKEYGAAKVLFVESLRINQRRGEQTEIMALIGDLGLVAYHLGDYGEARAHFETSLAQARQQGIQDVIAVDLLRLGDLARLEGDYERAGEMYAESLEICREIRDVLDIASSLHKLGQVARQRGEGDHAWSLFRESLALQRAQGNRQGIVECLFGLGGLLLDKDEALQAARLFGAAETLLAELGAPLAPADEVTRRRDEAVLREQPDGGDVEGARREGATEGWEPVLASLLKPRRGRAKGRQAWLTTSEP